MTPKDTPHDESFFTKTLVDASTVRRLYADGLITDAARDRALVWLGYAPAWWVWINRLLLFFGVALALAGVVFFFAFNWAALGRFAKFALLEALLLACLVGAWRAGIDRLGGKVLALAAAVVVGTLLAVFGQAYQTGADAYELFTGWALLILGWTLAARFGALWAMWLLLVNLAVALYWSQVIAPGEDAVSSWWLSIIIACMNFCALAAREYFVVGRRVEWLAGRWLRWVVWAGVMVPLLVSGAAFVSGVEAETATLFATLLLALATGAGGFWFYRLRAPDLPAVTVAVFAVCVIALTIIGRVLFRGLDDASENLAAFIVLVFGLSVVGVFGVAGLWLRGETARMRGGER